MIIRNDYLNKLKPFINAHVVKILCGIRRCGKSTILQMLKDELIKSGINSDHIIVKRYTEDNFDNSLTAKQMFEEIKNELVDDSKYYLILDEVQEISNWEKAVNSLFETYNVDIYITGSNSRLMSSEISTYLTGRYIMIPVYTLSFNEYVLFKKDSGLSKKELFNNYIRYGGFPLIASSNFNENVIYSIVQDIYYSIVLKDIVNRQQIKNVDLFNRVTKFVIENIGKTFSANSIKNFLKAEHRNISVETIYNYLEALEKAFIIYRCKRYDLKGKYVLKTQEKFYLSDQSIKYALFGFDDTSVSSTIENVVFLELKRRNYDVYIGKIHDKEIDFVAINRERKLYIQVCRKLPEDSNREIANLLSINDNYEKLLLTLDEYSYGNINGIKIMNIIDFLFEK